MLALALVVPLFITGYTVPVEPAGVGDIREFYGEVYEMVDGEYPLYETILVINPGDVPYPAVGNYTEETTFYWDLDMEFGETDLLLVTHASRHAAHSEYLELLYNRDGELIFLFRSFDNGDEIRSEERRWFSDGELLHATNCTVGPDGTEYFEPGDMQLMRDPDYFLALFETVQ